MRARVGKYQRNAALEAGRAIPALRRSAVRWDTSSAGALARPRAMPVPCRSHGNRKGRRDRRWALPVQRSNAKPARHRAAPRGSDTSDPTQASLRGSEGLPSRWFGAGLAPGGLRASIRFSDRLFDDVLALLPLLHRHEDHVSRCGRRAGEYPAKSSGTARIPSPPTMMGLSSARVQHTTSWGLDRSRCRPRTPSVRCPSNAGVQGCGSSRRHHPQ
jgi:hypothetical protein